MPKDLILFQGLGVCVCVCFGKEGGMAALLDLIWVARNGEGNGTPLQYPCLENPMDERASKAAVHGVAEGRT